MAFLTKNPSPEHHPDLLNLRKVASKQLNEVSEMGAQAKAKELRLQAKENNLLQQAKDLQARELEIQQQEKNLQAKLEARQPAELIPQGQQNTQAHPATRRVSEDEEDVEELLVPNYPFSISRDTLKDIRDKSDTPISMARKLITAIDDQPDKWWISASLKNKVGKTQIDPGAVECVTEFVEGEQSKNLKVNKQKTR